MEILHPNNAYINYFNISSQSYSQKINFYEEHKSSIDLLIDSSRFEIEIDYILALFEVGRHKLFLGKVDSYIEQTIINNIHEHNGQDLFCLLLFKKAAARYNTDDMEGAVQILKELISIHPNEASYQSFLRRCYKITINFNKQTQKGSIVLLFLAFIFLSALQLFVVDIFFADNAGIFSTIKNATLILAIVIWAGVELYQEYKFRSVVNRLRAKRADRSA